MNTIKTLLAAILIASSSFSFGFSSNNEDGILIESPGMLKERLVEMIHVPVPIRQSLDGTVEVTFQVQENGRIKLLEINGENEYLNGHVREDIKGKRLITTPEMHNNVYKMKLVYGGNFI